MIKLSNVNKYYKDLHVLKGIDLALPDTGFISIVGESGSGKSTLLNIVGGLDSYNGDILYDDKEYSKNELDLYRQDNIGIVFQNYLLFEDMTVYENLEVALRLSGIKDKEECEKRIKFVLEQVGMYKMRKKLAKNLSGGQQQRVSIARALIKQTKVLLADEPTGNLDRKNTIEIMNILKQISKTTLVLLVTHNREMADIYSDNIINILDGNITSLEKTQYDSIKEYEEDKIYLEDYTKEELTNEDVVIELYGDIKDVNIKIIKRDGNLYLTSDKDLRIINNSNIKEKREEIKVEELSNINYDVSFYSNEKRTHRTLMTFKEAFIAFFSRRRKRDKFFNISFFLLGAVFALAVATFFSFVLVDDTSLSYYEGKYKVYYNYDSRYNATFKDYSAIEPYISNLADYLKAYSYPAYKESTYAYQDDAYNTNILMIDDLSDDELIAGNRDSAVVSTRYVDRFFNSNYDEAIGEKIIVTDYRNITKEYVISGVTKDSISTIYIDTESVLTFYQFSGIYHFNNRQSYYTYLDLTKYSYDVIEGDITSQGVCALEGSNFTIGQALQTVGLSVVAIVRVNNLEEIYNDDINNYLCLYDITDVQSRISDRMGEVALYQDDLELILSEGSLPTETNGCIIPENSRYDIGDTYNSNIGPLKIVGTYKADFSSTNGRIYVSKDTFVNTILNNNISLAFDCDNPEIIQEYLTENYGNAYYINSCEDETIQNYKETNSQSILVFSILTLVLLLVYIIFVFFTMRTKVLKEDYNIAVYRALGATKLSFYVKYIKDILVTTLFTSTLAYIICFILYSLVNSLTNTVVGISLFSVNLLSFFSGLAILYLINIVMSVLPIFLYLRKQPSSLISKYDM